MAKKDGFFKLHLSFLVNIAAMLSICAGLMIFQQLCLNHPDDTFLSGNVCMADTYSRALLAAALTVSTTFIAKSVATAAMAFRTAKLASGIGEGAFVALGSNTLLNGYIARAILGRGRWAAPVVVFVLALHSQNLIQTVANLGIQVSQVYVGNNGTAYVFDNNSLYNVTDYTVPSLRSIPVDQLEGTAVQVLAKCSSIVAVLHPCVSAPQRSSPTCYVTTM